MMFSVNIVHLFKFFFMGKKKKVLKGRVKKVESCLDKINQLDPVIQGLGKQKRTAGGGVLSLVENLHESFFVEEFEAVVGYVKGVEDLIMDLTQRIMQVLSKNPQESTRTNQRECPGTRPCVSGTFLFTFLFYLFLIVLFLNLFLHFFQTF